MKKLKVTLLSATACALLGTSMVSAEETTASGNTTVTYEPGVVSPTDATWAVSMPVNVTLNDSNIATKADGTSVASVGQSLTFTIFDKAKGENSHTGNENVTVTLENATSDGSISMTTTTSSTSGVNNPKIALAKSSSSSSYELITNSGLGNVGILINSDTGTDYTFILYAGIVDAGDKVQEKNDKASVQLTFKFTKTN